MFCKSYRKALIDAAASGEALRSELEAHVAACKACSSAFAAEQAVFASIDGSLHAAAKGEVPASLVPRVRSLAASAELREPWHRRPVPVLVPVLALAAILSTVILHRQRIPVAEQEGISSKENSVAAVSVRPFEPGLVSPAVSTPVVRRTRRAQHRESPSPTQPDVLVPDEERVALAKFVADLRGRQHVAQALLSPAPEASNKLLDIKPLEVAKLEIKRLSENESETSVSVGGTR